MVTNIEVQHYSDTIDTDIPAWKRLDEVVRKWAVMSQHNKAIDNYLDLAIRTRDPI